MGVEERIVWDDKQSPVTLSATKMIPNSRKANIQAKQGRRTDAKGRVFRTFLLRIHWRCSVRVGRLDRL